MVNAHDLLWGMTPAHLPADAAAWAVEAVGTVVVRRATVTPGWVAVGVRGRLREQRLRLAEACRAGPTPPPGLWLLSQDANGRPQLVAPSATPLPAGHPGRIALVGCGDAEAGALVVPDALADWLKQHSGAIYVTR